MKQVSTFLYSLGEESESVLTSMNATANDRKEYAQVIKKFNAFFKIRKNVIFERARFNCRNHLTGETAEQYIMTLYTLAEPCEYGNLKDEMIRDRLVVGIRDHALSERLQLDADLTLEKAKKSVRQREAVQEQQLVLKGASEPSNVPSSLKVLHSRKGYPPGGQHGSHSSNRCGEGRLRPKLVLPKALRSSVPDAGKDNTHETSAQPRMPHATVASVMATTALCATPRQYQLYQRQLPSTLRFSTPLSPTTKQHGLPRSN